MTVDKILSRVGTGGCQRSVEEAVHSEDEAGDVPLRHGVPLAGLLAEGAGEHGGTKGAELDGPGAETHLPDPVHDVVSGGTRFIVGCEEVLEFGVAG